MSTTTELVPTKRISALLASQEKRLARVLPKHLSPAKMIQVANTLVYRTPKLQECEPNTILAAVLQACELGLSLSPAAGEAYLVPRWNSRAGVSECQMQPGYRGLAKLAIQSGAVVFLDARLVREGEPFEVSYEPALRLRHVPHFDDSRPITHVYSVAKTPCGEWKAQVLSVAEVEKIHRQSESFRTAQRKNQPEQGPWVEWWDQMALKCAVKRMCKQFPQSPELTMALEADDQGQVFEERPALPPDGRTRTERLLERLEPPAEEPEFTEGVERPVYSEDDSEVAEGREPGEEG